MQPVCSYASSWTFEYLLITSRVYLHSANHLVRFYYQVFRQRADETCWPSTGRSWSQTCHFGPHHPSFWRNTGSYCVISVTKGSHLAADWKCPPDWPRKTWLPGTTSHRGSGLWHWRDLVASPWLFYVEIATTLTGQMQWVSDWVSTCAHKAHMCVYTVL